MRFDPRGQMRVHLSFYFEGWAFDFVGWHDLPIELDLCFGNSGRWVFGHGRPEVSDGIALGIYLE